MSGHRRATAVLFFAGALLAASSRASAIPIVKYGVTDLGGGLFRYSLAVKNTDGSEPLSGITILHGDTVFGLDADSTIGAPADWSYFAPFPLLIDDLNYFSLDPDADVPIDGILLGFFFVSTTDPDTLAGDDFAVEGIGAESASQIDLGNARPASEPASVLLLVLGVLGLVAREGRERLLRP